MVEVTCDGDHCASVERIELDYVYHSYSGKSGQYEDNDSKIEKELIEDHEWTVIDGKHYCSEDCIKDN